MTSPKSLYVGLLYLLSFLCLAHLSLADDYYSVKDGGFDDLATWQVSGATPTNLPDATDNVYIKHEVTKNNITSPMAIHDLTILDGGVFRLYSNTNNSFEIKGSVHIKEGREMILKGATVSFLDDLKIDGTLKDLTTGGSPKISFHEAIKVSKSGDFKLQNAEEISFVGKASLTNKGKVALKSNKYLFKDGPIILQNESSTDEVTLDGEAQLSNNTQVKIITKAKPIIFLSDVVGSSGAEIEVAQDAFFEAKSYGKATTSVVAKLHNYGTTTFKAATTIFSTLDNKEGSTVIYDYATEGIIVEGKYYNVRFRGDASKFKFTGDLEIHGDAINESSMGMVISTGTGPDLSFYGSKTQHMRGKFRLELLEAGNSASKVILDGDIKANDLKLQNGKIELLNDLTVENNITGYSADKYIITNDNALIRMSASADFFPIGTGAGYKPVKMTPATSGASASISPLLIYTLKNQANTTITFDNIKEEIEMTKKAAGATTFSSFPSQSRSGAVITANTQDLSSPTMYKLQRKAGLPFVTEWMGGEKIKFKVSPGGVPFTYELLEGSTIIAGTTAGSPPGPAGTHGFVWPFHVITIPGYDATKIYTFKIYGDIKGINIHESNLRRIVSWGSTSWESFENAFNGAVNLTSVDPISPNMVYGVNMHNMFSGCNKFNSPLNGWDVSKVVNMYGMFDAAQAFNQELNNWDVSNVTAMGYLFLHATSFDQDLSSWDVSNVTGMERMFERTPFNHDISGWNVSNVTNMYGTFAGNKVFNQDLSNWIVSKVTRMDYMFGGAASFNQNLGKWKFKDGVQLHGMLSDCGMDRETYEATLEGWDTNNPNTLTSTRNVGVAGLKYCDKTFRDKLIAKNWRFWDHLYDCSQPFVTTWKGGGDIIIKTPHTSGYNYSIIVKNKATGATVYSARGVTNNDTIPAVSVSGVTAEYQVHISGTFPQFEVDAASAHRLLSVDSWGSDIHWKSFKNAFKGCTNLKSVPGATSDKAPKMPIYGVSMEGMFEDCDNFDSNLNGWDVSNVTDMTRMFGGTTTKFNNGSSDGSKMTWNTINVKKMGSMFSGATSFNQNINDWNVSQVDNMSYMFESSSFDQSLASWKLKSEVNLTHMLDNCAMSVDNYDATLIGWDGIAGFTTKSDLGAAGLKYCAAVDEHQDLIDTKLGTITDAGIDASCKGEPFVTTWTGGGDITIQAPSTGYDYSIIVKNNAGVTVESHLNVSSSKTITLGAGEHKVYIRGTFPQFGTSTAAKLKSVDKWGDIEWKSFESAFNGCENLETVPGATSTEAPNLASVNSMSGMFEGCTAFNADLTGWDVSAVVDMSSMFEGTDSFNNGDDAGKSNKPLNWTFPTNAGDVKLDNTEFMFQNCPAFNQDLSTFKVNKVTNMEGMFNGASSFDQSLASWQLQNGVNLTAMLDGCAMSIDNYDETLIAWDGITGFRTGSDLGAAGLKYCAAAEEHQNLIDRKLGTIDDAGIDASCKGEPFVTTWTGGGDITIQAPSTGYDYSIIVKNNAGVTVESHLNVPSAKTITLGSGEHKVYIRGTFPQFGTSTAAKLKSVDKWGDIEWKSFENAFKGCTQLTAVPGAQVVAPAPSEAPKLGSVTNLKGMFEGCKAFNADISGWDVSTIDNMSSMFKGASTFDQDLNSWDVTGVTDMTSMFEGATSFSQNLKDWKVNSLRDADHMLDGTKIDVENYDATLIGWYTHIQSLSPKPTVTQIGVDGLKYCNGEHARQELGWTFRGDSKDCSIFPTINAKGPFVYGTTYDKALSITKAGTSYIPSGATYTVRAPAELGTVSIDNGTRHLKLIPKEVGDFILEVDMTALGVTLTYVLPITVEKAPQDIDATNFDLTTVDQSTYTITGVKLKRMENGILTDTEEPQYILKNDDGVIIIEGHTFKITGESGITQIYAKKDGNKYYKPAEEVFIAEITAYDDQQANAIIDQYTQQTKVYPNPLQEGQQKINIELPNAIKAEGLYLYDEIGRHIDVPLNREGEQLYFKTQGLARGLYVIVIETDKGAIRKKLSIL